MRSSQLLSVSLLAAAGLLLAPALAGVASAQETSTVRAAEEEEVDDWNWDEDESADEDTTVDEVVDEAVDTTPDDLDDAIQDDLDILDPPELEGVPDKPTLEGEPTEPEVEGARKSASRKGGSVENLYVTATKREESIQDVAISMKALNSDFLKDSGLTEFGQLQQYVPNLTINPVTDSRGTVIRIRGIGSIGNNSGIDPSVGVFIDGVYQGRAGMSVGDMLDVERVEVLRGPQGTLYGKNTAAGLINVISKRPHYELESTLEGVIGNFDAFEGRGSINVPIIDGRVATRLSGYRVVRDGFDENFFDDSDINDGDKWGLKSRWLFDFTDTLSLLLTGDYSSEDTKCCVPDIVTYEGRPTLWAGPTAGGFSPGHTFQGLEFESGIPLPEADPFDRKLGVDVTPMNEVDIGGVSFDLNYELPPIPFVGEIPFFSGSTIQAIGAWRTYSSDSRFDGDFSFYDVTVGATDTSLDQYSAEVRFASPDDEIWTYQAGFYYYHQSQDTEDTLTLQGLTPLTLPFLAISLPITNVGDNHHTTTSYAGFAQTTISPTEKWSVTGGVRYTKETKTRRGTQVATCGVFCFLDTPPLLGPDIDSGLQERTVENWTGMASLRFFPTDEIMTYFSFATGFKSGGFNQLRTTSTVSGEFDDEESTNYEVGAKTTWLEGMITLNGTFFYTDYEQFQAQTFDGSSINVINAGSLVSYGFEGELVVVPLPEMVLGASFGWNVAEYTDFEKAEQTAQQRWDAIDASPIGPPSGLMACNAILFNCNQDLSDKELENAPEFSLNVFASYEYLLPFFPVALYTRADYSFQSDRYLAQDLDPHLKQDDTHLVNLRAGLKAEDERWDLTFWITNLTDEEYGVVGFDAPTLNGFAMVNGPPRQYGATVRLNF